MPAPTAFDDLLAIMDRLREPGGCPWDREQSYSTLRGYLIEECYEVVEALDRDDRGALCEELGDLLFQIVFLSRLAKEEGAFDAGDVIAGIAGKMVRRHPHVFGDESAADSGAVLKRWEEIKRTEKTKAGASDAPPSALDGIPSALPSLVKAQRLGTKAARVGFDWDDDQGVIDKLAEEGAELREALRTGQRDALREEIGDAIFTLVMLARRLDIDADEALARANDKFRDRFVALEGELRDRGLTPQEAGAGLMNRLWEEAKSRRRE